MITGVVTLKQAVSRRGEQPVPRALSTSGVTTSDTSGLAEVRGLFGSPGIARWKALMPGSWKGAWYTELLPGGGCGRQLHPSREEVYYVVSGSWTMTVNDLEEITVSAGYLIPCPVGTFHGARVPADAAEPMAFFAMKLPPAIDPPHGTAEPVPMPTRLAWTAGCRGEGHDSDVRVATSDLRNLTGPWRRFSLIEIPPGTTLGPYELPVRISEVLFFASGAADITGNVTAKGQAGLFVGIPMRAKCQIRNPSSDQDLYVISTEAGA
jgi:mannose-6-phosphate isomerase-like protein (cupin superfamily)